MRPGLCRPQLFVDMRELPHKRAQRHIGQAGIQAKQIAGGGQLLIQPAKPGIGIPSRAAHLIGAVAVRILAAIERRLEELIVLPDQGEHLLLVALGRQQPTIRITRAQGMQHDLQTLLDDRGAIRQHQHRHRSLGRDRQHRLRLVPQFDLAKLAMQRRIGQGQSRPNGIGAAAERIENGERGTGIHALRKVMTTRWRSSRVNQ